MSNQKISTHGTRPHRWPFIVALFAAHLAAPAAERAPGDTVPLNVLLFTGGTSHNYEKAAPYITNCLGTLANVSFVVNFTLDPLRNADFAASYDAVIFD